MAALTMCEVSEGLLQLILLALAALELCTRLHGEALR